VSVTSKSLIQVGKKGGVKEVIGIFL
jgi:hypothetical protein